MQKAERLKRELGGNMAESMGIRTEGTAALKGTSQEILPLRNDERQGRTAWRQTGYMSIANIVPDPEQPRKEMPEEYLKRLGQSIEKVGQLQPITIRWNAELGKHVIVMGECRYQAVKLLGHESIKCIFDGEEKSADLLLQEQLIENCVREDLNDMDRARAFEKLRTLNGWNAQQLADALCVSKATVSRTMKLLNLPGDVQEQIADGQLSASAAYQVASKETDQAKQRALVDKITTERLTRDEAAKLTGARQRKQAAKPGRPTSVQKIKTSKAEVVIKFHKKRVTREEWIAALEEALDQVKAA